MAAILLSNIVKFFVPLGLLIWAIFAPSLARYFYLTIYSLLVGYLFILDRVKPNPDPQKWSSEEINIINKYHVALKFPFGAKDMSAHLNGFRWSGILWLFLFLLNQMWLSAAFVVVAFFVTASISVRLDPFFFLGQSVKSGNKTLSHELFLLQQVANKLNNFKTDETTANDKDKDEDEDEDIEDIYDKYINKKDLPGSLSRLNALINDNVNDLKLLDAKAEVLYLMDKEDEAIKICEQILNKDETYANAYSSLVYIYLSKGIGEDKNYSQKIVDLEKKLESIAPDKVGYSTLANSLKNLGNFEEALSYYKKAIEKEEHNFFLEDIYKDIAMIYTKQKLFTEALKAYDEAIQCAVDEDGNDNKCSELYAFKRNIYEQMNDQINMQEMDKKFAAAEMAYKNLPPHEFKDERFKALQGKLSHLAEGGKETSDKLKELVLLMIEEKYKDQEVTYDKLGKIIDDALKDVDYEEGNRPLEKARLVMLLYHTKG